MAASFEKYMPGLDHLVVLLCLIAIPLMIGLARQMSRRRQFRMFMKDVGDAIDDPFTQVLFEVMGVTEIVPRLARRRRRRYFLVTIKGALREITIDVTGMRPQDLQGAIFSAATRAGRPSFWESIHSSGASTPAAFAPPAPSWSRVLDLPATVDRQAILARWRELARIHHPDAGGDQERMKAINEAKDQALASLR